MNHNPYTENIPNIGFERKHFLIGLPGGKPRQQQERRVNVDGRLV